MYRRVSTITAALAAAALIAGFSSATQAANGNVNLNISKGGWVIGGTNGTGTMRLRGRTYPLVVSGVSCCFTFGGSQAVLNGTIANVARASDIEGSYSATSAGATIGQGQQAITLTNSKGAMLQLTGAQQGLMVNVDLGGMTVQLAPPAPRVGRRRR
jgi:hypothetical protein